MKPRTILGSLALFALGAPVLEAQNSTRKIRKSPSELAAKAGSSIPWKFSLSEAIQESKRRGKPVFWYLPSLKGSPMDRQDVVDRSMMAGPFSWPRTVKLLSEEYVPLRLVPSAREMQRLKIEIVKFVEPGYLVLDSAGKELARLDEITTLHPLWFLKPLSKEALPEDLINPGFLPVATARLALDGAAVEVAGMSDADRAELWWLQGAGKWSRGDEAGAHADWGRLIQEFPQSPLAAKAAMEREGFGPYVRGIEVTTALSAAALELSGDGSRRPGVYSVAEVWERGARFLQHMQRADGGFTDSVYDFGGTDSMPNVYVAGTAIAAIALLEASEKGEIPGLEASLQAALEYASDDANMAPEDRDERAWAHLYRVHLFTRWLDRRPQDEERIRPRLEKACLDLVAMQGKGGAWYHEYQNGFITAQSLVALHDAKEQGVRIDDVAKVVGEGVQALQACRTPQGAYTYTYNPNRPARARVEAGVGQMPLASLALWQWKVGKRGGVAQAIQLSFEHQQHLFAVQKYDDHASRFTYGGFFFWWDLWARTQAIAHLPPSATRERMIQQQRQVVLDHVEYDGCFVDSHELGRSYGTAKALWCLALLDDA